MERKLNGVGKIIIVGHELTDETKTVKSLEELFEEILNVAFDDSLADEEKSNEDLEEDCYEETNENKPILFSIVTPIGIILRRQFREIELEEYEEYYPGAMIFDNFEDAIDYIDETRNNNMKLVRSKIWLTRRGVELNIVDMSTKHLKNVKDMIINELSDEDSALTFDRNDYYQYIHFVIEDELKRRENLR